MSQYLDVAAGNVQLFSVLGVVIVWTIALFIPIASLRRKAFRQQEELAQLTEEVANLRLAEERRFLADLRSNPHDLRAPSSSYMDAKLDGAHGA